jgi:hypothetical protein
MHGDGSARSSSSPPDQSHTDQAQVDLLSWIEGLVETYTGNDWEHIDLRQAYDPEDESKQNSIRTNATLVFVNGSLTIDDVTAIQTVACYVGVSEHPLVLYVSGVQRREGVL